MKRSRSPEPTDFTALTKNDVRALADALQEGSADDIETGVQFVCAESLGVWHGRGRAMICRRLKHIPLNPDQKDRLVQCILQRLMQGRFAEQFRDQLRLTLSLDAPRARSVAARCIHQSEKPYVIRFANWLLSRPTP